MPTYEYLCNACGDEFEAFQSMKDDPLTTCQRCGAEGQVRRKIGRGAGIIFKGSGFYETDFKDRKGAKPSPSGDAAGSGKKESGAESSAGSSESSGADAKSGKKSAESASTSTAGKDSS